MQNITDKILIMRIRLFTIFTIILLITTSCSKDKDCDNPIDCLPPITQTGANTAGCLVNGKVLIPDGRGLNTGSVLKAQYTYSGEGDDDFVFGLSISDLTSGGSKMMLIRIRNKILVEGEIYELKSEGSNSIGSYNNGYIGSYVTTDDHRGELVISHIDPASRTVSGTFWFDAADNDGEVVEVRNGRFDVFYY